MNPSKYYEFFLYIIFLIEVPCMYVRSMYVVLALLISDSSKSRVVKRHETLRYDKNRNVRRPKSGRVL